MIQWFEQGLARNVSSFASFAGKFGDGLSRGTRFTHFDAYKTVKIVGLTHFGRLSMEAVCSHKCHRRTDSGDGQNMRVHGFFSKNDPKP